MKKWMAMALALCMLCGMVNVTYAEAAKIQTIGTAFADFDIPAGVEYEIIDSSDDRFCYRMGLRRRIWYFDYCRYE